jgi:hypothetical protein
MKTLLITGTRRPMWLAIHEALVLWGQARVADLPDIVIISKAGAGNDIMVQSESRHLLAFIEAQLRENCKEQCEIRSIFK